MCAWIACSSLSTTIDEKLMAKGHVRLENLEQRLGHVFQNKDFLRRALTHASAVSPAKRIEHSYQRLEFLGDRVLGLTVADLLFRRDDQANEGALSVKLNAVVKKQSCAEVARELDLGAFLNLGESEARSGGAKKEAILADVCEAVIGAIYMDAGFSAAFDFVQRAFADHLENAREQGVDAKTQLQEWAQARGLPPPQYQLVEKTGPDHAPIFMIAVNYSGFEPVLAQGPSKKAAEHKAASQFLAREGIGDQTV